MYGTPSASGQYTSGGGGFPSGIGATIAPFNPSSPATTTSAPKPKKGGKKHKGKGGAPGINKYLAGDTTYNEQLSELRKQLEQFQLSSNRQQGNVRQDFATAIQKMNTQKGRDLGDIQGDYAARGVLNSGLYTGAVGKYNTDWNQQYNELNTDEQRSLADLTEALQNYRTENQTSLAAARADAIRRRAQQYGITTP